MLTMFFFLGYSGKVSIIGELFQIVTKNILKLKEKQILLLKSSFDDRKPCFIILEVWFVVYTACVRDSTHRWTKSVKKNFVQITWRLLITHNFSRISNFSKICFGWNLSGIISLLVNFKKIFIYFFNMAFLRHS